MQDFRTMMQRELEASREREQLWVRTVREAQEALAAERRTQEQLKDELARERRAS